jgi:hypothetical protein
VIRLVGIRRGSRIGLKETLVAVKIVPSSLNPTKKEKRIAKSMTRDLNRFLAEHAPEALLPPMISPTGMTARHITADGKSRVLTDRETLALFPPSSLPKPPLSELGIVLDEPKATPDS